MSQEECHKEKDAEKRNPQALMKNGGQSVSGLGMMTWLTS